MPIIDFEIIQIPVIYVYAVLLLILNLLAWTSNVFMLPGNWLIVGFSAIYAYLIPETYSPRIDWGIIIVVLILAIGGEIVEFLAGAAATRKEGGSRKSALLSVVGAFLGSLIGVMAGIPIPVLGSVIGALGGGAVGAFAGAYIGETGRIGKERIAIGKGAFWGRLIGTAGKLAIGVIILVVVTIDSFYDLSVD